MNKINFRKDMIGKTLWLPNGQLIMNPNRIRKQFNDEKLDILIKTFRGSPTYPEEFPDVIVPVFIGKKEPDYINEKCVVGIHNTITLAFQKGRKDPRDEIRVKFLEYNDWDEVLLQSWRENHDREDVSTIDDAVYFMRLKENHGSNEAVAKYLGRDEKYIQRALAIANLQESIKKKISAGGKEGISKEIAEVIYILRIKGVQLQEMFSEFIERYDLSLREAREYARELKEAKEGTEIAVLEQFKKKQMAKQNLRAIEESFKSRGAVNVEKVKKVMKKKEITRNQSVVQDFVYYVTEVGADMQNLLKDLHELERAVGNNDVEDFVPAIGKSDKQKVRDSIKAYNFGKKKLQEYFKDDKFTRKVEVL